MIPEAYLTAWARQAPWPTQPQIEQDLVLSRLMIEVANHELLGAELAMRGGTCLHKLHLAAPARYSEDLEPPELDAEDTVSALQEYLEAVANLVESATEGDS